MKITNTFKQDLSSRLPDVQRVWLRRSATLILTPFVIVILLIVGAIEGCVRVIYSTWNDFVLDCWYGRN